jgi:hypothetical protein
LYALAQTETPDLQRGLSPDEIKKRHFQAAGVEYEQYLFQLLRNSGFATKSIEITPRPLGLRPGRPYSSLVFGIKGRATGESVNRMLKKLRSKNPPPQIGPVTIDKHQDQRELDVAFTVETVVVPESTTLAELLKRLQETKAQMAALERQQADLIVALREKLKQQKEEIEATERALREFEKAAPKEKGGDGKEAKLNDAKAKLRELTEACDTYRLMNNGSYPPNLAALTRRQPNGGNPLLPAFYLTDPWDQPYGYDPKGTRNGGFHADIWFKYKDQQIGNWPGQR